MLSGLANGSGCGRRYARAHRRISLGALLAITPFLHGCPGVQVVGGGSPISGTGSAMLTWDAPTTDTDGTPIVGLAGYHIFMGTDPNNLSLRGGVNGAQSTSFEVSGIGPGTFYFAVTAFNEDGEESAKSNLGNKTF